MNSPNQDGSKSIAWQINQKQTEKGGKLRVRCTIRIVCTCGLILVGCVVVFAIFNFCSFENISVPAKIKVAVLVTEDQDIVEGVLAASKYLQNDYYAFETLICANSRQCLNAFLAKIGRINNFIVSIEDDDLVLLCGFIKKIKIFPKIASLSDVPSECDDIVQVVEDHSQLIVLALAKRVTHPHIPKHLFIIEEQARKREFLRTKLNPNITYQVFVLSEDWDKWEWLKIISVLRQFPESTILFSSGRILFKLIEMLEEKLIPAGRTIAANLNSIEKLKLVKNVTYRDIVEKLDLITASDISNINVELAILKRVNLLPNDGSLLGVRALFALHRRLTSSTTKHLQVDTRTMDIKRLIPKALLGAVFIQQDPWLRESMIVARTKSHSVSADEPRWQLHETHSPFQIITKEQILHYSEEEGCSLTGVQVSAMDPSWNIHTIRTWNTISLPSILFIPNSNPKGFTMTLICEEGGDPKSLEVGCLGKPDVEIPVDCIMAKISLARRRRIRSYTFHHAFPLDQQMTTHLKLKEKKKDLFKNILPQIGACIGATGGCCFCFIFLLHVTSSISPGVCYGACSIGVGGSCSSLIGLGLKVGYEYKYKKYTVICSELYEQGYIDSLSYLADARYGSRLSESNPLALRGYQSAAFPLVHLMERSPYLAQKVHVCASPWIRHMEFKGGIRDEDDPIGKLLTTIGIPLFTAVGLIVSYPLTILLAIICLF